MYDKLKKKSTVPGLVESKTVVIFHEMSRIMAQSSRPKISLST